MQTHIHTLGDSQRQYCGSQNPGSTHQHKAKSGSGIFLKEINYTCVFMRLYVSFGVVLPDMDGWVC